MMVFENGMSSQQGRKQRAALLASIDKGHRDAFRATMRKLYEHVKGLRSEKRAKLLDARKKCSSRLKRIFAAADAAYKHAVEKARETRKGRKELARWKCKTGRIIIRSEMDALIALAGAKVVDAREMGRLMTYKSKPRGTKKTIAEWVAEDDEEVLVNIPEEQVPLWQKIKRKIRGSQHMSRTEAFQQWVHENPEAVIEAQEEEVEAFMIAELEKKSREEDAQELEEERLAILAENMPPPRRSGPRTSAKSRTRNMEELMDFFSAGGA